MHSASVGKGPSFEVVMAAYDRYYDGGLIFMSGFGYSSAVKAAVRDIKKKCEISLNYVRFTENAKSLTAITSHMPESDYSHLILYKKDDTILKNGEEKLRLFLFIKKPVDGSWDSLYSFYDKNSYPQVLIDSVYDKLYKVCPAPILKEWVPFLINYFIREDQFHEATTIQSPGVEDFFCGFIETSVSDIVDRIQYGLRTDIININNSSTSLFMQEVQGIDAYLSEFSEVLTEKIQKSFVPMFDTKKDSYGEDLNIVYDFMKCNDKISLYPAQLGAAQAITNAFNEGKRSCFIVAEMGAGILVDI